MVAAPRRVKGTSLLFDVFVVAQGVGEMLGEALADGPLTPEEYAVYSHLLEAVRARPRRSRASCGCRPPRSRTGSGR